MIRNQAAYWNTVNRNAPAIRWTLADRGGVCEYWKNARRFERQARERGDGAEAAAQAKIMRKYENVLETLNAAEGGGI